MDSKPYIKVPSDEHQHELTMLYLQNVVNLIDMSPSDLATRYLEIRGEIRSTLISTVDNKIKVHSKSDLGI